MRFLFLALCMTAGCAGPDRADREPTPEPVKAVPTPPDPALEAALKLFQDVCLQPDHSFEAMVAYAEAEQLVELPAYEIEPLIKGLVRFQTRAWIAMKNEHQLMLLAERGGFRTHEQRLAIRAGQITKGNPVGEGWKNPFRPKHLGVFSCSVWGTDNFDRHTKSRVETVLPFLASDETKFHTGSWRLIGRFSNLIQKRWRWEQPSKTGTSIWVNLDYSRRAPEETIWPNFQIHRSHLILDESDVPEDTSP